MPDREVRRVRVEEFGGPLRPIEAGDTIGMRVKPTSSALPRSARRRATRSDSANKEPLKRSFASTTPPAVFKMPSPRLVR